MKELILKNNLADMAERGINAVVNQEFQHGLELLEFCCQHGDGEQQPDVLCMLMVAQFSVGRFEDSYNTLDKLEALGPLPQETEVLIQQVRQYRDERRRNQREVEMVSGINPDEVESVNEIINEIENIDSVDLTVVNQLDFDIDKIHNDEPENLLITITDHLLKDECGEHEKKAYAYMFNKAFLVTRDLMARVENLSVDDSKEEVLNTLIDVLRHFFFFGEHVIFLRPDDVEMMLEQPALAKYNLTYLANSVLNAFMMYSGFVSEKDTMFMVHNHPYGMDEHVAYNLYLADESLKQLEEAFGKSEKMTNLFRSMSFVLLPRFDEDINMIAATFAHTYADELDLKHTDITKKFKYSQKACNEAYPEMVSLAQKFLESLNKNGNR